jgi:two-component system, NarL family, sensor histidine kinase DegS
MPDPTTSGGALASELAALDLELGEIDMLVNQARVEAGRHEQKRAQAEDKLGALISAKGEPKDVLELTTQIIGLTRRAALMEAQVEVLEGKRKTLGRFRDSLARHAEAIARGPMTGLATGGPNGATDTPLPPAVSRMVLAAQEDLRREIARAMHDGPAQSLTNIVLQAQIVEHLVAKNPELAPAEVRLLMSMVQQTLEATKSFIFDVRPMVLDDLGLVPTLRRAARDRGRRAGVAVEFESLGADRRLPMELESGLFRILDEALAGYLSGGPDSVTLRLDWSELVEARVTARRAGEPAPAPTVNPPEPKTGKDLPPALAAMMEDRRADRQAAAEAARDAAIVTLPPAAWKEIQQRAATLGVTVELLEGGGCLRVATPIAEAVTSGPERR